MGAFDPIRIPEWAWRGDAARQALRTRDAAGILRIAQRYGGASQHRIANAVGILQGRVSEILKGSRHVTALEVFERIADGLRLPDDARVELGLAPRAPSDGGAQPFLGEMVGVYPQRSAATTAIRDLANTASTVDILSVRGLGVIGLGDSVLRAHIVAAPRPMTVRVLLADPHSPTAAGRAAELGETAESFAAGTRLCLERLRDLTIDANLTVHLYDAAPIWRMLALDQTVFVSSLAPQWAGHEAPTYKITEVNDGTLSRGFRQTFDDLRSRSKRVI
jgi:hypothetical protein